MTRDELIDRLIAWNPPVQWDGDGFKERDALQFGLWWYGASTEANKPTPSWPGADYVRDKTGGGPHYLHSIDLALSLIPKFWAWSIQRSDRTACEVWLYPPDNDADIAIYVAHQQMPLAICIAAMRARLGTGERDG
jgi:hypothetical protein